MKNRPCAPRPGSAPAWGPPLVQAGLLLLGLLLLVRAAFL